MLLLFYFVGLAVAATFLVYASKIPDIRTTSVLIMFDFLQIVTVFQDFGFECE